MTFDQARSDPATLTAIRAWLAQPARSLVFGILRENPPRRRSLLLSRQVSLSEVDAALVLGVELGYDDALEQMQLLGEPLSNALELPPALFSEA